MRILKSNSILKLVNSYIIDASQPSNISYLWNFGSLLAVCLVVQLISGITLAMINPLSFISMFCPVEYLKDIIIYPHELSDITLLQNSAVPILKIKYYL